MALFCEIFRSSKKEEMYLYVERAKGLEDVPDVLMKQFGEPKSIMTLMLSPESKLARANADEVLENIRDKGFYLQMPPTVGQLLARDGARD